ncbi:hypothetical protein D3C81_1903110 [compost metagenome]
MAAPNAPALYHPVEVGLALHLLQCGDEFPGLICLQVEHEVRVAGKHAGIDGQAVQARLVAQRLAGHESHVAVRAVAQCRIDFTLAAG